MSLWGHLFAFVRLTRDRKDTNILIWPPTVLLVEVTLTLEPSGCTKYSVQYLVRSARATSIHVYVLSPVFTTLCVIFVAPHCLTKHTVGRVLVVFRLESVYELINVTSNVNVNGWLPVQDGGTWRSGTDSYVTSFV